jgi:hypothetical protein
MQATPAPAQIVPQLDPDPPEGYAPAQPIPDPIHCPHCSAVMLPAITPGGEAVYECSGCAKVCYPSVLRAFLNLERNDG